MPSGLNLALYHILLIPYFKHNISVMFYRTNAISQGTIKRLKKPSDNNSSERTYHANLGIRGHRHHHEITNHFRSSKNEHKKMSPDESLSVRGCISQPRFPENERLMIIALIQITWAFQGLKLNNIKFIYWSGSQRPRAVIHYDTNLNFFEIIDYISTDYSFLLPQTRQFFCGIILVWNIFDE